MLRNLAARVPVLLISAACVAEAATFQWDGGATTGSQWSLPENWVAEVAPPNDGTAELVFEGSNRLDATADNGWSIHSLTFAPAAGAFQIRGGQLTLGGGGLMDNASASEVRILNHLVLADTQTWTSAGGGALRVQGNIAVNGKTLTLVPAQRLDLEGALTGSGTVTIAAGTDVVRMLGFPSNTLNGSMIVNDGAVLELARSGGGAVSTLLSISSGGTVRVKAAGQFASSAQVTVRGLLDLGSFDERPGQLSVLGGSVTGSNSIKPNALIYTSASGTTPAHIGANLDYTFSSDRRLIVNHSEGAATDLRFTGAVKGPAATVVGNGILLLQGNGNTWTSGLTLSCAEVAFGNDFASGPTPLTVNGPKLSARGGPRVISTPLVIGGDFGITGALDLTLNGPLTLTGNRRVIVDNAGLTTFAGAIGEDGPGRTFGISNTFDSPGVVRFAQSYGSPRTGVTSVSRGRFELANTPGVKAFRGGLVIGGFFTEVVHLADDQIDGAKLRISGPEATLDLAGFTDSVGDFEIVVGTLRTGPGTLRLNGNITTSQSVNGTSVLHGNIDLNGGHRTITVHELAVLGYIDDCPTHALLSNGSLTKAGAGTVGLHAPNTFAGGLIVTQGQVLLGHDSAAGTGVLTLLNGTGLRTSAPRAVTNTLALAGNISLTAPADLTLSGMATLQSDTTLNVTGAGMTTFAGAIGESGGGRGLTKAGTGSLRLSGASANTYSGATIINAGTLILSKEAGVDAIGGATVTIGDGAGGPQSDALRLDSNNNIADEVQLVLNTSGLLHLEAEEETVASCTNDGTLNLREGLLEMIGDYSQATSGALRTEITGPPSQLSSWGRLFVGGQAALRGAVHVVLNNSFGASIGDQWEFLTTAGPSPARVGTFDQVNVDARNLPSGSAVVVRYTANAVRVELVANNYQTWADQIPFANSEEALPDADPERDGVPNLLEYALNMDPLVGDAQRLPKISVTTIGSERYLTLTYQRLAPPATPADVLYATQRSTTLASNGWSGSGTTETVTTDNESGLQTVVARSTTPIGAAGLTSEFLRLAISQL